jgi:hypothetical protein
VAVGKVTSLTEEHWYQSTLTSAAASSATSLAVDNTSPHEEDGGWVVVTVDLPDTDGGTGYSAPIRYTTVDVPDGDGDDDSGLIYLASPVGVALLAGDDVWEWDPDAPGDDKRVRDALVQVTLDDNPRSQAVPALIKHGDIPVAGADSLLGASVAVDDLGEGLTVVEVFGRDATIDLSAISHRFVRAFLGDYTQQVPTHTVTPVMNWGTSPFGADTGFSPPRSDGAFQVPESGFYLVVATASWAANSNGARYLILQREHVFRGDAILIDLRQVAIPSSLNITASHQVSVLFYFGKGDWIRVAVQQTSGAALDLVGSSEGALTGIEIFRAAVA